MARQRGGGRTPARSAPSRPTAAPARSAAPPRPQQTRAASTTAQPPAAGQQQAQGGGSGLFGQMASTAAGVAVGSTIGHAMSGFFGGGSSQAAESQPSDGAMASQAGDNTYQSSAYGAAAGGCEDSAKAFTRCLDENTGNQHQMSICSFYLDQLKACQSAASQY